MKRININKKGYAYLLTAAILIAIVLIVFLTVERYKFQDRQEIDEVRIKTLNDFVKGFNDDVKRATYISAFRTLLALEDNIATTGIFFNNTEEQFKETFYYGTINGKQVAIVNDSSMLDYLGRINNISNSMNINSQINITNIALSHKDPWTLLVKVSASVNISDVNRLASWNYEKEFETELPIENLRDPLYSTFTNNRVPNTVIKNPYSELINDSNNDTANLEGLINNSYYVESADAPSFLMRFENDTSADPNGIESIVNVKDISDQDITVYSDRIKIDYMYFNDISASKICDFEGLDTDYALVLPANRADEYEVNEINYSASCP